MPSAIYRVQNDSGNLEHSFSSYSVKLDKDHCVIEFPETQDIACDSFKGNNVNSLVPCIMSKLSVALDIPYSPENIRVNRYDQGDNAAYGNGSRYRCPFPSLKKKNRLNFAPEMTPEERAKEYGLTPPADRHEVAKALLDATPNSNIAILAADRWSYGKYLEYMGLPDEAFLKYYKSMEVLGVEPKKSNPNADNSIQQFIDNNKEWIVRYRHNWFAHHDPQAVKKNLDYIKLLDEVLKKDFSPIYSYYWDSIIREYEDEKDGNMERLHFNRAFCRHLARYEIMTKGFGLKCKLVSTRNGHDMNITIEQ